MQEDVYSGIEKIFKKRIEKYTIFVIIISVSLYAICSTRLIYRTDSCIGARASLICGYILIPAY